MSEPLWGFSDSVSEERRTKLSQLSSFDDVVEYVASCKIKYYTEELAEAVELKGCSRASFLLQVKASTYDAFFNSAVGYRAQYCSSVGDAANRRLIEKLRDNLLEFASKRVANGFDIGLVKASLEGDQAKIWVLEDVGTQARASLNIEILYKPWVDVAMTLETETDRLSWRGVLAPTGRHLEVKGGWFDKNGRQFIDDSKRDRPEKIHRYGYAG
jgi:hypothetical protein